MTTDFTKLLKDLRGHDGKILAQKVAAQLSTAFAESQKTQVTVESTIALTEVQKDMLKQALTAKFPDHTTVRYSIRPELITGLRIVYQDIAYDYSTATTLTKLITAA